MLERDYHAHNPQGENIDLLIRGDEDIADTSRASKRHSSIVRKMRLIFPVAALAVFGILLTWKSDNAPVTAVPREQVSPQTIGQNELINPKFQSEDSHSQPYTITADKAVQNAEDMDTVHLQKPMADVTFKSGGWVALKASNGIYQQTEHHLNLDGNVEVRHDSGYELHTEKMNIDITGQQINSDTPVTGHGPAADINASGLEANGNDDTLIFKGPAKLILRKEGAPSSPSNPPTPTETTGPENANPNTNPLEQEKR